MSVDGAVAGAAANMAVAADFVVASEKAKFIQAFVGIGLAPDAGGLFLMSRAIGTTRAIQLAMTGEGLNAQKALEYGIVYRLCESEKLERTTNQLTKRLLTRRSKILTERFKRKCHGRHLLKAGKIIHHLNCNFKKNLAFKRKTLKEGVRAFT